MKTQILTLIIMLAGLSMHGQNPGQYLPDTIWWKSGEAIPCKIVSIDSFDNTITVRHYNANGQLTYEPMSLELVETYFIGEEPPEIDETPEVNLRPSLLPDSLKTVKAYLGFGFGFPHTVGLSFTVILKNDWGGSIGYKYTSFTKKDCSGETGGILGSGAIPGDNYNEFSLCVAREFLSKASQRVRFGLEAGPSLVYYEKVNSYYKTSVWFFGTYYSANTTDYITAGLALRAKIEFPVTLGFGLELALYGNLNPQKPHGGIELYFTVGKVRERIKPVNF